MHINRQAIAHSDEIHQGPAILPTKRVLFLDQSGQLGGAELCLRDLLPGFAGSSEVVLFQDGPFREMLDHLGIPVKVIQLGRRAGGFSKAGGIGPALMAFPGFMRAVAEVARCARSFDIIYANTAKAAIVAAPASQIADVPMVVHLHDIISARHFGKLGRFALVRAVNHASLVIANSEATRAAFVDASRNAPPIKVIPNGFHPEGFADIPDAARQEIRASLGVGDHFTVGVFGRISEWKGQHVLLAAMHRLPGVHVVIVGDALFTEADRNYAERLRILAEDPALLGRVHFAGFRDDTPALMHAMDAIAHTSVAPEPFGRVIVEAMLCGKPVVATAPGGPSEILAHGATGLLVPSGDAAALASSITTLKNDPVQATQMGRKARDVAIQKYNIDNVIRSIADCLAITSSRLQS